MYTILMYSWCRTSRPDNARKLLKEMIDQGIEPNIVTYNILFNGLCRHVSLHPETRFDRTIHSAEEVLKEMQRRCIQPEITSYSIVLHVYSRAHKSEWTLCKFRAMREQGISPSIATYTSVVKCLTSCGRLDNAYGLLDEMSNNGIQPAPATINCFFKEYFGRKDVNSALKLYHKMKDPGSFDIHTYHILLRMFIKLE
jgi:pentatricopeptide repeat protein